MKSAFVNRCRSARLPRRFLDLWLKGMFKQPPFQSIHGELVIVFVDPAEMKSLNMKFRSRNYATDVLSFESGEGLGVDDSVFGELVICPRSFERSRKRPV